MSDKSEYLARYARMETIPTMSGSSSGEHIRNLLLRLTELSITQSIGILISQNEDVVRLFNSLVA